MTQVLARLKTSAGLLCEIGNFVKGRTLVERGGVRVGDVWRDGSDRYRVTGINRDCVCTDGVGDTPGGDFTPDYIADTMTLVERDGKAV